MPGVFKVITYKDILEAGGTNQINGLVMLPKHNKNDGFDRPVLCRDKIFQFGDAIAIVAAETEEQARAAAEAVKVDIEELPAYMNAIDAMAPDAIEIHPGTPNVFFETNCIKGGDFDWDSIPDSQQVEIESYCSRQPHLHLEPDCGLCLHRRGRDAHHTLQVHRHTSSHANDSGRHRCTNGKAAYDTEPCGRHLRV